MAIIWAKIEIISSLKFREGWTILLFSKYVICTFQKQVSYFWKTFCRSIFFVSELDFLITWDFSFRDILVFIRHVHLANMYLILSHNFQKHQKLFDRVTDVYKFAETKKLISYFQNSRCNSSECSISFFSFFYRVHTSRALFLNITRNMSMQDIIVIKNAVIKKPILKCILVTGQFT